MLRICNKSQAVVFNAETHYEGNYSRELYKILFIRLFLAELNVAIQALRETVCWTTKRLHTFEELGSKQLLIL